MLPIDSNVKLGATTKAAFVARRSSCEDLRRRSRSQAPAAWAGCLCVRWSTAVPASKLPRRVEMKTSESQPRSLPSASAVLDLDHRHRPKAPRFGTFTASGITAHHQVVKSCAIAQMKAYHALYTIRGQNHFTELQPGWFFFARACRKLTLKKDV